MLPDSLRAFWLLGKCRLQTAVEVETNVSVELFVAPLPMTVQNLLSSQLLSKNLKIRIYKTIILPVVLYGCETWSPTLREEHKMEVFENRVLKRIFGPKRDEVHNEELHDLYSSPSIIRIIKAKRMRWAGHVAQMARRGTRIGCWWEIQREGGQ
jgi:hypothetical protein